MAFTPRQFTDILSDMITYVRANTTITDFQIGSAIRTILEAAAIEDDEQYFQMVSLMDAFSIFSASGTDLIAKVAEYDITPLQPSAAVGEVVIHDGLLVTDALAFDVLAGALVVQVADSSIFPTSGFPYNIRIGEGTLQVEDVAVSANTVGSNSLTCAALDNDHSIGERVSYVTGVSDRLLNAGLQVQVPAAGTESAIVFNTLESGTIVNGDYTSTPIRAQAVIPGIGGNVGTGRISQFTSSAPFGGALVSNITVFGSGRGKESDEELRSRALLKRQALKATPLSLKEAVLGVTDAVTRQRVASASVLEDFVGDEVIVYIDDGTGFVPDQVQLAVSAVDTGILAGVSALEVVDADDFPEEGYIVLSPENGAQIELVEYTAVDRTVSPAVMTLATNTANAHDAGDEIVLVDVFTLDATATTNYFKTYDFPVVRNSERLWIDSGAGLELQTRDVDYVIKRGLGRIELEGDGVVAGGVVVSAYSYYTGLVASCQRIINGDENDEVNYPGVYTAGMPVVVETPTIRRITVRLAITTIEGKDENDLAPIVASVVESYISSLGIGKSVIVAEIIERAMRVPGMFNVAVQLPTSDITCAENELPVPYSASGTSLVTVS